MRKIIRLLLAFLLVFLCWSFLKTVGYQPAFNGNPPDFYYLKGAYHIHSTFSDGTASLQEICTQAKKAGLDFIVLTDHGNPNSDSLNQDKIVRDVLVVGGTEVSTTAGHLVCFGFKPPAYNLVSYLPLTLNEIRRSGGSCFAAHPFDAKIPFTQLEQAVIDGMEILNCYHLIRSINPFKLLIYLGENLFHTNYAMLKLLFYPGDALRAWDAKNRKRPVAGIFALDAHGAKIPLIVPAYYELFKFFNIYVRVEQPERKDAARCAEDIKAALARGNFFSVLEAIGSANGFDFYFQDKAERISRAGEFSQSEGELIIKTPFEFPTRLKIIHNGQVFRDIRNNSRQIVKIAVKEQGFYRLEVFQEESRFSNLIWILSNPIYLGAPRSKEETEPAAEDHLALEQIFLTALKAEQNQASQSRLEIENELIRWNFCLGQSGKQDFWSALAYRKEFSPADYNGLVLEIRSEKRFPLWINLRSISAGKEIDWRQEFFVDQEWQKIVIPFRQLRSFQKQSEDLKKLKAEALFIVADNMLLPAGFKAAVELRLLGFYK